MLPLPRIIAIDDKLQDLDGLCAGLNSYGAACLRVLFTGDDSSVKSCPHVRVIFADLHLTDGGATEDHAKHFAVIGGLIQERIVPTGPYLVVLWTRFPDQAGALQTFLERMTVPKPLIVIAIDKTAHLKTDGAVKDITKLISEIAQVVDKQPQMAALLNWEERALGAAGDTVAAVLGLVPAATAPADRTTELARILARLAAEAVGEEHVKDDRFHAVNEALLPILSDRLMNLRVRSGDENIWKNAFSDELIYGATSLEEAAAINRFLHIAPATPTSNGAERGAVIALPDQFKNGAFGEMFGLERAVVAGAEFYCDKYTEDEHCQWVLVQMQAACDFAQSNAGPLPYFLGLELLFSAKKKDRPSQAVWSSPCYERDGQIRILRINGRFPVVLAVETAKKAKMLYRLREPLLSSLAYSLHTQSARPGVIGFSEKKAKAPPGAKGPAPAKA